MATDLAAVVDQFSDWRWRLNNLYWITDKDGRRVRFQMNWAQEALFDDMHFQNLILKARQLGFTTFIQIFMLDACVWIVAEHFQPETLVKMTEVQLSPEASSLLKDGVTRNFQISVDSDSMVQPNEDAEKQRRTEFMTMMGGFLGQHSKFSRPKVGMSWQDAEMPRCADDFRDVHEIEPGIVHLLLPLPLNAD